ncbi:unnamed protein product [Polarella glacialis]|jgi:nucleoid DNA-binding protein|uniref:Uncharacterized protein n=1 Tax=Polarella glacialis TaxID=89957 RepID=A0A813DAI6_POLGL|nr:unnamed protein product [Polarella glacialis]CAE8602032.1 unnamed protein product [Polarella glacialis]
MKAGKPGKMAMMKGCLVETLASETGLRKSECSKIVDAITTVGAKRVKRTGKFVLPGLCVSKTRQRAAAKAGKRNLFGKTPLGLTMASTSGCQAVTRLPSRPWATLCLVPCLVQAGREHVPHRSACHVCLVWRPEGFSWWRLTSATSVETGYSICAGAVPS